MKTKNKLLALLILGAVIATGCNTVQVTSRDVSTNGATREVTIAVRTRGDAKQAVENLRASNGKTLSIGAQGVEQESTTANVLEAFKLGVEAMAAAGAKAVKP